MVEAFITVLKEKADELGIEIEWAQKYLGLKKGKRLANVLMDDSQPGERDLAVVRQNELDRIVEEDFDGKIPAKSDPRLWAEDRTPSDAHLQLLAYAFTPAQTELEKLVNPQVGKKG